MFFEPLVFLTSLEMSRVDCVKVKSVSYIVHNALPTFQINSRIATSWMNQYHSGDIYPELTFATQVGTVLCS